MAKITDSRETVHWGFELHTREHPLLDLYLHNSMVVLQVAVPPQQAEESDTLSIQIGNRVMFRHPLRPLMDMYRSELLDAAYVYMKVEQRFAQLLDGIEKGTVGVHQEQLEELHRLHRNLRFGTKTMTDKAQTELNTGALTHLVPQAHAAVGVLLARALLVPPRVNLSVHCEKNSGVTVYLGGLVRRDTV